jgi:hypothetical protein
MIRQAENGEELVYQFDWHVDNRPGDLGFDMTFKEHEINMWLLCRYFDVSGIDLEGPESALE